MLAIALSACGSEDDSTDDGGAFPPGGPQFALAVTVSGSGTVGSQPAGIDCGSVCTANFMQALDVVLTAAPAAGQVFSGWGGACAGTSLSCTVSMSAARVVTATFVAAPPFNFTLSVLVSGAGTLISQPAGINCGTLCSASFASASTVVLTPTPAAGQTFTAWGGICAGAGATCTVTMSEARSASASFAPLPAEQIALNLTRSGSGLVRSAPAGIDCGSVCTASFASGSSVVLTATPAAGQTFSGWAGACSGTQATCTVAMSEVRNVTAAFAPAPVAAQWQTAQLLENSDDFNVAGLSIGNNGTWLSAIAPNGDVLVLWEQSDGQPNGSTRKVFSRRYAAGQGWDPAVTVAGLTASSTAVTLVEGQLLIAASGTATWIKPNGEARRYTAAAGWGSAIVPPRLSGNEVGVAVIDAAGDITVLASGDNVFANTLPATGAWGNWVRVDASGNLPAQRADLALGPNGSAMAIWRERNPGDNNYSMKAARYTPAAGWQAPQSIENVFTNVNADSQPRVALDDLGNAIAFWHQGSSVYYNVFSVGSGWGSATEADTGQVSSTFSARTTLSMTPDGRAVATWNSGIFGVRSMQYTPGAGFSAPVAVAPYSISRSVGIDNDGTAVMVYLSPNQWPNPSIGTLNVYTRQLAWGGSWSDATLIETRDGDIRGNPAVKFNKAGQGVAVWAQNDLGSSDVRNSLWVNLLR